MFAARRIAKVKGRIIKLIDWIITINDSIITKIIKIPWKVKWQKKSLKKYYYRNS